MQLMSPETINTKPQPCPVASIDKWLQRARPGHHADVEAAWKGTSGNRRKATQALTSDVLPCLSLPFQELPEKPSCEAAEGLSAAPGRGHTGSVVSPMVSRPPPAHGGARTQLIQPTYAPLWHCDEWGGGLNKGTYYGMLQLAFYGYSNVSFYLSANLLHILFYIYLDTEINSIIYIHQYIKLLQ